jgi:hypothetical protein
MSSVIVFNGISYTIPDTNDVSWGASVTAYLKAIPGGVLAKTGGAWHLTSADLDLGATYGVASPYFKSKTASISASGVLRLALTDLITWRKDGSSDYRLGVGSNGFATWETIDLVDVSSIQTLTNKVIDADLNTITNIRGLNLAPDAAIAYSQLQINPGDIPYAALTLTGQITNADISPTANIAGSKINTDFGPSTIITSGGLKLGTTNFVTLNADPSADYDFTFPDTDGIDGQALVRQSGELVWASIPGLSLPHYNVTVGDASSLPQAVDTSVVGDILADPTAGLTIKSSVIINDMVSLTAGIEFAKMEALTGDRALQTDSFGVVEASATTVAELGYLSGVTNSVQTQLNGKVTGPGSAVSDDIAIFNGATGSIIKDSGVLLSSLATTTALSAKVTGPASAVDLDIPVFDSTTGKLIKDSGTKIADLATASSILPFSQRVTDSGDPIGLVGSPTVTYQGARTVRIAHPFAYWYKGTRVSSVADIDVQVPNVTGNYFIVFTDAALTTTSTTTPDIINQVMYAGLYWNAATSDYMFFDERHGISWSASEHAHDHLVYGAKYESGGSASGYTLNNDTLTNVQIAIGSTSFWDEDIKNVLADKLKTDSFDKWYRSGVNGDWAKDTGDSIPAFWLANVPKINTFSATWALTNVPSGNFFNTYIMATNSKETANRFILIPGQTSVNSLTAVQAISIKSLSLGTLPVREIIAMYQITMEYQSGFNGNNARIRIRSVTDLKNTVSPGISNTSSNHNSLAGRSDADSHPSSAIGNDVSAFNKILSSANTTVQSALDSLDDGAVNVAGDTMTGNLLFTGDAAKTVGVNRNTTTDTAGVSFTHTAGGATSAATDKAGGDLILSSGISTGTGTSTIQLQTATAGTTGTADRTPTTKVTILGNGNVGIGTSGPTQIIGIDGTAARVIGMERATSGSVGNSLTVVAGGSQPGTSNQGGGNLILDSGSTTGTGASDIQLRTTTAGTTGTSSRAPSIKMIIKGNGNVGIGTSGPTSLLSVAGDVGLTEIATPTAPAAGIVKVYAKTDDKLYIQNSAGVETPVGSGSGSSSEINYISNPLFEETANAAVPTGWVTYADAAAATPVDGTGGSPTVTFTASTSSPIRGLVSAVFTKDAANRQGQGVAYAFTIPAVDKGKLVGINFDITPGGSYASSDMSVYVYDVTNSVLITPAAVSLPNLIGTFTTSFGLTAGTSYRLILHVASTNASAYTLKIDNVSVGYKPTPQGAVVEGIRTKSYATSDFGAVTGVTISATTNKIINWRVGETLRMAGTILFTNAAAGSDNSGVTMNLPISGISIRDNNGTSDRYAGINLNEGVQGSATEVSGIGYAVRASGTQLQFYTNNNVIVRGTDIRDATGYLYSLGIDITIPIAEWAGSGTVNLAQNDVEYASNSSTTGAGDTTSFAYGQAGSLIPTFNSAATTGSYDKYVKFQSPIQSGDKLTIEIQTGGTGNWIPLEEHDRYAKAGRLDGTAKYYGMYIGSVDSTTLLVGFGIYGSNLPATWGGTSGNYPITANDRWRVRKTSAGAAVGFGQVSENSSGLFPAYNTNLDNATATRLGLKQYLHGTTYNGGNAPTVTLSSGGGTLSAITRAIFVPYQCQDNTWRMRFTVNAVVSSATRTSAFFAVAGVTTKNVAGYAQSIAASEGNGSITTTTAYCDSNANTFGLFHASGSSTIYRLSGDVELESKPTWAY